MSSVLGALLTASFYNWKYTPQRQYVEDIRSATPLTNQSDGPGWRYVSGTIPSESTIGEDERRYVVIRTQKYRVWECVTIDSDGVHPSMKDQLTGEDVNTAASVRLITKLGLHVPINHLIPRILSLYETKIDESIVRGPDSSIHNSFSVENSSSILGNFSVKQQACLGCRTVRLGVPHNAETSWLVLGFYNGTVFSDSPGIVIRKDSSHADVLRQEEAYLATLWRWTGAFGLTTLALGYIDYRNFGKDLIRHLRSN